MQYRICNTARFPRYILVCIHIWNEWKRRSM